MPVPKPFGWVKQLYDELVRRRASIELAVEYLEESGLTDLYARDVLKREADLITEDIKLIGESSVLVSEDLKTI